MPVTADSYEAKVMERALFMLCSCASFRSAIGAATAELAKAYVIESWGGDAKRHQNVAKMTFADGVSRALPETYAIIDMAEDGLDTEEVGVSSDDYRGTVMMTIYVPRKVGTETAPESMRRARNLQGAIRSEYRAQFGADNCLARHSRFSAPAVLPPDAEGPEADLIQIPLDFDWYA
jgi:hypothetical protein